MPLRVIGAGIGRTGTYSLKLALQYLLGGRCYHMVEVFPRPAHVAMWTAAGKGEPVDWNALFAGFVAAVDWPTAAFWKELSVAFPEALVLLSTRDSESWWKSASETIFAPRDAPPAPELVEMSNAVNAGRFDPDRSDKQATIAAYERRNELVRATVHPSRLVEWRLGDGWGPLCAALGMPVPDEPFPHTNTTEDFKAWVANGAGRPRKP